MYIEMTTFWQKPIVFSYLIQIFLMKCSIVILLILIIGSLAATEEQQIEAVKGLVSRVLGKVSLIIFSEFAAVCR